MQTLILAGGEGVRLRPQTLIYPKSMILAQGKPFLERLLTLLTRNGVREIILSIGYLGGQIKSYFGDGSYWGLDIRYSFEQTPRGTGGAVKLAEPLLEDEFFIINGDTYLDIDYQEMFKAFRMSGRSLMMGVYPAERSNCRIGANGSLAEYRKEKLSQTYIDAGVWIAKKEIFDLFPNKESFSLESEVLPKLVCLKQVKTFISEKRSFDIGTFEELEKFREYIKKEGSQAINVNKKMQC